MATQGFRRKLTAILSADVKGYSRLMGEDEETTVQTLTSYRELMSSLVREHRGRVVDSPGDNMLVEFTSVVDAVECAAEIQKELKIRNAEVLDDRKMEFRIGVNLGDVIQDGERIYGDGVNIAARLESLAEGGGICISGSVFDSIRNKLPLGYEYIGERRVKNIAEPIRVYRILTETEAAGSLVYSRKKDDPRHRRKAHWALVAGLILVAIAVAVKRHYWGPRGREALTSHEEKAELSLPDIPSIAVLPFLNMSQDPEQEYFSDGITEDLITDLSRVSGLFVIARNSVFAYKGQSMKAEEIGKDLGVRYLLEGSVRKADGKVRITAQLIDAATGGHVWAERYDRELTDIFALQDEVTRQIVEALALQLGEGERSKVGHKYRRNRDAYDYVLRGVEYSHRMTKEGNLKAREMFEKAIELDPEYAQAYSGLGWTYFKDWSLGWSQTRSSLGRAWELAQKAIALDESEPEPHCLLGNVYLWKKQHERAIDVLERSIDLNPNYADAIVGLGNALTWAGRPEEAVGLINKAMRLNPRYPAYYQFYLGHAHFLTGRYDDAVAVLERVLIRNPNFHPARIFLAASYIELGQQDKAESEVAGLMSNRPKASLEVWGRKLPYKDPGVLQRLLGDLRKAGLM